jgi:hypothetical protein
MRNKDKIELILIIIMIILPFSMSIWCLLTSGVFNELLAIILSNNKILGALLLSFLWIAEIGQASEFIRQSQKRSERSKGSA